MFDHDRAALTALPGRSNVNGLTGFVRIGSNVYSTTTDGREVCMTLANRAPCPHQPYATTCPPSRDAAGIGPVDFIGSQAAIDGRIFIASNDSDAATTTRPHPPTVTCFDPAIAAPCAGWGPLAPTTTAADAYTLPAPAGLSSLLPSRAAFTAVFPPLALRIGGGLRDYFPLFSSDGRYRGNTACYDWTAQAPCATTHTQPPRRVSTAAATVAMRSARIPATAPPAARNSGAFRRSQPP